MPRKRRCMITSIESLTSKMSPYFQRDGRMRGGGTLPSLEKRCDATSLATMGDIPELRRNATTPPRLERAPVRRRAMQSSTIADKDRYVMGTGAGISQSRQALHVARGNPVAFERRRAKHKEQEGSCDCTRTTGATWPYNTFVVDFQDARPFESVLSGVSWSRQ